MKTPTMPIECIKELAAETLLQAAKDYCTADEHQQKAIIKNLNSSWMDLFTDGLSKVVAQRLQTNEQEIYNRLKNDGDMRGWRN